MSIRKWASNSHELVEAISPEIQENKNLFIGVHNHTIRALFSTGSPKHTFGTSKHLKIDVVTMSLPEHKESFIEYPSVELQKPHSPPQKTSKMQNGHNW